ncbi:2-methylaconitate cis-trans isomerase PrpF family protein [Acidaminococcus massiliensis]|uniref:2-methylaconitate cis-trans isomerase PrpF family protein n=1 Tax=Acidaminococcus massiliensis TaxID=1852375 RepID=UPI003A4D21F3
MYQDQDMLRCSIIRGGTSKGIFLKKNDLPKDPVERDKVILKIFGSPDVREIDGLGGADVLTSKLAIIGPSTRSDADVDYTFGQVSFDKPFIDYKGNCGNISAAVGPYAIDEGMVEAKEPYTDVRIHLTNSDKILVATVPVKDGKAVVDGNCHIDGVPGTGARIDIDWSDTAGSACGKLLPTGHPKDLITIGEKQYEVSLIDMGNPLVFISAEQLGMKGIESVSEIEENKKLMQTIEKIRSEAALIFGMVDDAKKATTESPYAPFFAIVSKPTDYTALNGNLVRAQDIDIVSRLLFMLHMHKAYPITGTVCTGAAVKIKGSVAYEAANGCSNKTIRIGHPSGVVTVDVETDKDQIKKVKVYRTARRIMDGYVYVKK